MAGGIGMDRTMLRFAKSQTRIEPRIPSGPGYPTRVLTGLIKSEVIMMLASGRTEIPWGLKPSVGGLSGHSCTSWRFWSNSATRPGDPPVLEPIIVTRNPPPARGIGSSVILESWARVEEMELGFFGLKKKKKKMSS